MASIRSCDNNLLHQNYMTDTKLKKMISVVSPCYNEEKNVEDAYSAVKNVFSGMPEYEYEHIFIDNCSEDKTVEILKGIAKKDKNLKIIMNVRNFGQVRSPYYGMLQSNGDAVVMMPADLQDPPSLITTFVKKWEDGYKIVIGTKGKSDESPLMFGIRKIFYFVIRKISETDHIDNFTGYGLYDKDFVNVLRKLDDPYPYFRGLVSEIGFERAEIPYVQKQRRKGKTKNNFSTLYDIAMLGFVNHSKMPLRLASFIGFSVAILSLLTAFVYLVDKLVNWNDFDAGTAPLMIGLFFFSSVQLIFIGIMGEYLSAVYTKVKHHPLVVEKERINFD